MNRSAGFSLVELLIALTVCTLISSAIAATVPPSRSAFEQTPAALDIHQRTRTAVDAIDSAVRSALIVSVHREGLGGETSRLQTVSRARAGSQGVLASDLADGWAPLTLASNLCPPIADVCGFRPGAIAMITDGTGRADLFVVASADAATHAIGSEAPFSQPYSTGAFVSEVDAFTFRLVAQANGSSTLVRETAAGAMQPITDGLTEFVAEWLSPRELGVRLRLEPLANGPSGVRGTSVRLVIIPRNVP